MWIIIGLIALWSIFGIGGLIIGLFAALFKSNTFRNGASHIIDEILSNSNNHTNNQTTTNKIHHAQTKSTIQLLTPHLDILCHYALRYEPKWTSEKIKFIKNQFIELTKTQEEILYLRDRMKLSNRPPLKTCIQNLLDLNIPDLHETLLDNVGILLTGTCEDFYVIEKDLRQLAKALLIDNHIINHLVEHYRQVYSQYHSNNEFNADSSTESKLKEAADILGVSIDATETQINHAWRLKMKDFHPDRNVQVTDAVREMIKQQAQKINTARDYLLKHRKH